MTFRFTIAAASRGLHVRVAIFAGKIRCQFRKVHFDRPRCYRERPKLLYNDVIWAKLALDVVTREETTYDFVVATPDPDHDV